MNSNFLLHSPLAQQLYHEHVAALPVIDYHNHLDARSIAENHRYENIARLWVISDPYKHRVMRILGISENKITGDCSDYEKFEAWYKSLPRLIGNPLFDWSQMELSIVFDFDLLPFKPCRDVWDALNQKLSTMTTADILSKFNIVYSAPCASLTEDLSVFNGKDLCPSLRGDDLLLPNPDLLRALGDPMTLSAYLDAVNVRLDAFRNKGCKFADHALDNGFMYVSDDGNNESRFSDLLMGSTIDADDMLALRSFILSHLISSYARVGFTVQLHIGAQRTTSDRLRTLAGPAGGYAALGSTVDVTALISLLNDVEHLPHGLPNVMLFTLNPADNAVMATLSGSFSADRREALITQGPAWWWCDHYQGMAEMLDTFACHSVLSTFVGMTTDSRSILSFVRHDYFRRMLCQWIADMVAVHRLPDDPALLADTVKRMCYLNAKKRIGD